MDFGVRSGIGRQNVRQRLAQRWSWRWPTGLVPPWSRPMPEVTSLTSVGTLMDAWAEFVTEGVGKGTQL